MRKVNKINEEQRAKYCEKMNELMGEMTATQNVDRMRSTNKRNKKKPAGTIPVKDTGVNDGKIPEEIEKLREKREEIKRKYFLIKTEKIELNSDKTKVMQI